MYYYTENLKYIKCFLILTTLSSLWKQLVLNPVLPDEMMRINVEDEPPDMLTIKIVVEQVYPEPISAVKSTLEDESDYDASRVGGSEPSSSCRNGTYCSSNYSWIKYGKYRDKGSGESGDSHRGVSIDGESEESGYGQLENSGYVGSGGKENSGFEVTQEKTQMDTVIFEDSEEFCEELSFEEPGGYFKESRPAVFKYTNITDAFGFPIYFNEQDEQYMIRQPVAQLDSGYASDSSNVEATGKLSEYTFVKGKHTNDFEYISLLQKLMKPRDNNLVRYSDSADTKDTAKCEKKARKAKPASSIHAKWNIPKGSLDNATNWELGCTLKPLKSYNNTFFNTLGFGPGGYGGFQQTPDLKKASSGKLAIMSLWNEGENNVDVKYENKNEGIIVESFGGEGTGQKAYTNYPWEPGQEISIRVNAQQKDKVSNEWEISGYIKYGSSGISANETESKGEPEAERETDIKEEIGDGEESATDREMLAEGVSCGNHQAASCSKCGKNFASCHADCKWVSGTCQAINPENGQLNVKKYMNDNDSITDSWIHMVTLSRKSQENPLNEGGFGVFIEDWDRAPGKEGYLYTRSAEYRYPYLVVNGEEVTLAKPSFESVKTGLDSFASEYVIQKEIGPLNSGNIFMSTGKPS